MLKDTNSLLFLLKKKCEKVQVGNDQEMAQPERYSHSINRGVGKNYNDTYVRIPKKHMVSRVSSYSQIGGHSVTRTKLKCENVYKAQTAHQFDSKTQYN